MAKNNLLQQPRTAVRGPWFAVWRSRLFLGLSMLMLVTLFLTLRETVRLRKQIENVQREISMRLEGSDQQRGLPADLLVGIGERLDSSDAVGMLKQIVAEIGAKMKVNTTEASEQGAQCSVQESTQTQDSSSSLGDTGFDVDILGLTMLGFGKCAAGVALLCILAAATCFWRHPDYVLSLIPCPFSRFSGQSPGSLSPSKLLAYQIDCWLSTQRYSKAISLFFLTLVLVLLGGLAIFAVTGTNLYDSLWGALAGVGIDWTFAEYAGERAGFAGILTRVVATVISVGGLVVTALMLSIVSEAIGDKFDEMRRGVSDVLETNHTLILGWSDKLRPVINEICLANESIKGAPVVVMAERDKQEMEAELLEEGLHLRGSRIICRSGNPLLRYDLSKVSCHLARSIIVLADKQSPDQSDARVLRIVLSLIAFNDEMAQHGGLRGHIVAEMCDMDNEPLVKMIGKTKVETVVAHDIIGRLMIQCARQPGLAAVWQALMGFEGCEFYSRGWPELYGRRFGETLFRFPDAVPIGIKRMSGVVTLNPDDNTLIASGDQLIVLAEDEDTYELGEHAEVETKLVPIVENDAKPEKILFCGWRRDMDDMIAVLDLFVCSGSELWLYNEVPVQQRRELLIMGGLDPAGLKRLVLHYEDENLQGDLVSRKKLESLDPCSFSSILILADESASGTNIADADSRNLTTLLLLRDIMMKKLDYPKAKEGMSKWPSLELIQTASKGVDTVVISEILDSRTKKLIQDLELSEFVMSNELVSMVLAMVAESAEVNLILKELCGGKGNELYVYPVEKYVQKGEKLSFLELMARVRAYKEILMGLKYANERDLRLNPPRKTERSISVGVVELVVVIG